MKGIGNTKAQLTDEVRSLRQKIAELEARVTVGKQTEGKLKESEEGYRKLIETSPDAIFVHIDQKITFMNQAGLELLGAHNSSEIIGKSILDLTHPDYLEVIKRRQELLKKGEAPRNEYIKAFRLDGSVIDIETTSARVTYQGKSAIMATLRDITDRLKAEELIEKSRTQYRDIVNNSVLGMAVYVPGQPLVFTNKRMTEITGYSVEEIESPDFNFMVLFTEEDQRLITANIKRRFTGEYIPPYESMLISKTGDRKWVLIYNINTEYEGESAIQVQLLDISERKRAEERIQHLNTVLRAIRNVNQLITKEKDREKLLNGSCDNLVETRGYSSAWIALLDESGKLVAHTDSGLGKSFLPMVEYLKRGQLPACGQRALKQSEAVVIEDPVSTCADCPLSSNYAGRSAATVRLEYEGKVYGLLSVSVPREMATDVEELGLFREVATDIAFALHNIELEEKRKQAEEELLKHREHLEELVEGRTSELQDAQEKLVRSEKLAVLGQLAGGVGHELRNPLGAIKNAAYFLNMALEQPEPEVKETLDILEKEVATSERIISGLLGFARPKPPIRRKVDINEVIQGALYHVTVPENVKVVTQLDESLPAILADPDQLGQVFSNVTVNAIQAMPEGGQLAVKSKASNQEWVAISFADTGVGIPKQNLKKLFEPLFTTKAKGIGLGLAVTRTLVEGHGGTIEAQSEVGKGSTFTVKLPIGGGEEK